jgi:hypothetical protein
MASQRLAWAMAASHSPLGLEKLPVVEGDAVAQAETGHEVVAVQRNSLGQRKQAIGAYF